MGATAKLLAFLHGHSPLAGWLSVQLGLIWFWDLVFVASCLALGDLICGRALRQGPELPAIERLALNMAIGVVALAALLWLAGALRLLRPTTAVILPALLISTAVWRHQRRIWPAIAGFWGRRWPLSILDLAVVGVGVVCVGFVYLDILNPDALNHDAHWTHVGIAQEFARAGRLVPFRADWAKNFPHLASLLYTWVLLVPGLRHGEHLLLVMHCELTLFLWTLVAMVPATRWLTQSPQSECRTAWVAFFLFPAIFVYDSNLGGSADHVAAFLVLPLFLAFVRGSEGFSPGLCALAGVLAGGALITKYQSAYVIAPLGILLIVRLGLMAARRVRSKARTASSDAAAPGPRQALLGVAAMAAGALLASLPYFLENTVFYRNPFYPFLQSVFTNSRPRVADAPFLVSNVLTGGLTSAPTLSERVWNGLELLFTFSFVPHYGFLGPLPYFGFLFTLLAPLSLLLPRGHRLRVAVAISAGAILAWSMSYLVDRNLQIIAPLLAAVTAGVIVRIWQLGWLARAALMPLILVQLIWGSDLMFRPYLSGAIQYIRDGAQGQANVRGLLDRRAMTQDLPVGSVVLMHSLHMTLGLDREILWDTAGFQGLIDYHLLRTPREAYDRFRQLGVTHLAWVEGDGVQMRQADVIFAALVARLATVTYGSYRVAAMPRVPPPARPPLRVVTLGFDRDGVYQIDKLSACEMRPPEHCFGAEPDVALTAPVPDEVLRDAGVDAVLVQRGYQASPAIAVALQTIFQQTPNGGPFTLYLRR